MTYRIKSILWSWSLISALGLLAAPRAEAQFCPNNSTVNTALPLGDPGEIRSGVDVQGSSLVLAQQSDLSGFLSGTTVTSAPRLAAAGDINGDGIDDIVGVDATGNQTQVFINGGSLNFTPGQSFPAPANAAALIAVGDFNGDGNPDLFRADSAGAVATSATIWLHQGLAAVNPFDTAAGYAALADPLTLDRLNNAGGTGPGVGNTNLVVIDYNRDRKLDILVGSSDDRGSLRLFLNTCELQNPLPAPPPRSPLPLPCNTAPTFRYAGVLVRDLLPADETGPSQIPAFAVADFDGDGYRDLAVGFPGCCSATASNTLRVLWGLPGGRFDLADPVAVPFSGNGANAVLAADLSGDGRPDLAAVLAGTPYLFENKFKDNASDPTNPFPDEAQLFGSAIGSTDFAMVLNLKSTDNNRLDLAIAQASASLQVFDNAPGSAPVQCGEVTSGVLPLGAALVDTKLLAVAARLRPTVTLSAPSSSVEFFMSNENPPQWVPMFDCGTDLCVRFPKPTGRTLRWQARLCTPGGTSPQIDNVEVFFDYVAADEHFGGGSVAADGVLYLGSFSQPGERGQLHAINTGLSQSYWRAGDQLDAMNDSDRRIFVTQPDGTAIEFTNANAASLMDVLGAGNQTQAGQIIDWVRSNRFGGGPAVDGLPLTRLGSIATTTPAVVSAPGLPIWYARAGTEARTAVDAFVAAQNDRQLLVMAGAKDGMLHAFRNDPVNITLPQNGNEAWAFIPPQVVPHLVADYTASLTGELRLTAFPDGAPTVDHVQLDPNNPEMRTVAIIGDAKGGKSTTALDITQTIDPATDNVLGPNLLWSTTAGGAFAGQALSKPAIARVQINDAARFITIVATGIASDDVAAAFPAGPSAQDHLKGRLVVAYDISTGAPLWKFQTKCPVTTDITVFETNDEQEPVVAKLDGFMDRVVFADKCGHVYKVDPAKDLAGDWNSNVDMAPSNAAVPGRVLTDTVDGNEFYAIFRTADAPLLAKERPIAGNIGARADGTARVTLFFGTGGLDEEDPSIQNAFFAIYADTGEIRTPDTENIILGACVPGSPQRCEKFYGGVAVNAQQVIFSSTRDPILGTGTCDTQTVISAVELDNLGSALFSETLSAQITGRLYSYSGALFVTTQAGTTGRIGTPKSGDAGDDTNNGRATEFVASGDNQVGTRDKLVYLGWRQIY